MWETEIVENCGNVALTIASCFIFSELRESLSSVFNLCSWTWSRKKCVSTVHRDEWVRMEVWDEMCNLDRVCCSDASVCENRRIHMWVLLNVTVTEWFDIRTVILHTDCDRYLIPSKVSHSLPAMVERLVLNLNMCLSFRDEDCMCSRFVNTCLSKYASSRVRFHYVLTLFDRMSALVWFNMRNV